MKFKFKIQPFQTEAAASVNGNETKIKENPINENWKDFIELWERINKRYANTVEFDGDELIQKSIAATNHN